MIGGLFDSIFGGGSETQSTSIPSWVKEPAERNLLTARRAQDVGYIPYMGPDVAAFTPMQTAAMNANLEQARSMGLVPQGGGDAMAGMPEPQTFAGGVQGYSSFPMYQQAKREWQQNNPQQAIRYQGVFRPDQWTQNKLAELRASRNPGGQPTAPTSPEPTAPSPPTTSPTAPGGAFYNPYSDPNSPLFDPYAG